MIEMRLRSKISSEELESKVGKILTEDDFNVLVTRAARVLKPDGKPLLVYLPRALPYDLLGRSYDVLHPMRDMVTDNRQMASGSQPVMDGTRRRSKEVPSAIIGAFDASPPFTYCRLTAFNKDEGAKFSELIPLFAEIGRLFAEHVPDRFERQMLFANKTEPEWVVPGTPFTTITVNNSYPTGVHTDKGDLDEGFSTLAVLRRGDYRGGNLVFPEYRVAVDMQHGDLLLMDAHEWHGNVAITCNVCERPLPVVKENGRPDIDAHDDCGSERISVVSYYRTKMAQCGTPEQEEERHLATAARRTGAMSQPVESLGG